MLTPLLIIIAKQEQNDIATLITEKQEAAFWSVWLSIIYYSYKDKKETKC